MAQHYTQRITDWVAILSETRLPRIPTHSIDFDLSPRDLAEQVYGDPALVLNMIRDVNAIAPRHFEGGIHSMEEAVLMRGTGGLQKVIASMPGAQDTLNADNYRGYLFTCERAIHAACQARRWAFKLADMLPNEVFTAAMLRHSAELAMWIHDHGAVMRAIHEMAPEPTYASEAEYVTLGFSLGELNQALAQAWKLPNLVAESSHSMAADTRSPRSWAVGLAARLAALARQGWEHPEMKPLIEAISELLEISEDSIQEEITAGARDASSLLPWKPVTFAPLLLGEGEEGSVDAAPNPYLSHGQAKGGVCLAPRLNIFNRVRNELERRDYSRSIEKLKIRNEPAKQDDAVLNLTMSGLYDGLGLSRVLYAELRPDGETLAAKFVLGATGDPLFHRFRVDISRHSLIQDLMAKPAAVWLQPNRFDRMRGRAPAPLIGIAAGRSFFLASLYVGEVPRGIFYADRHRVDNRLDETSFKRFRRLCALASVRLKELSK
ncbi:HDOD domain-containing protein [Halorhodospira halochloris]|uniref:HDOD domain-containing protein n=1 Tax=Halorhodospira halochloris TaxID=1052 RepID=UPI001EE9049A|nr:HDOD domain-containing protein [Halorhodospira halochloris]MCG5547734.1 HDOD domain-containing protein [Halorhodospira halochloris]